MSLTERCKNVNTGSLDSEHYARHFPIAASDLASLAQLPGKRQLAFEHVKRQAEIDP